MTSVFTTGGIRGNKKAVSKFQPRSFNMGVKKAVFLEVGGFSEMRIGEDPDLSMTLWEKDTRRLSSIIEFITSAVPIWGNFQNRFISSV
jgi:cellulose synthase/poly-beta-1,6-N-acetylglucosamine synthase-like glycosyltransferase